MIHGFFFVLFYKQVFEVFLCKSLTHSVFFKIGQTESDYIFRNLLVLPQILNWI